MKSYKEILEKIITFKNGEDDTREQEQRLEKEQKEKAKNMNKEEATPYYKKASWIKKMSQAAKQERLAREKKEAEQKKSVKEETIQESYEEAEEHKRNADAAKAKGNMGAYHAHMVQHHEAVGQWHESKGRSSAADKEYAKAEDHHEQSLKHPYHESVMVQESDEIETSDYKLSKSGRKIRASHLIFKSQDDDEDKEKMKNEEIELDEAIIRIQHKDRNGNLHILSSSGNHVSLNKGTSSLANVMHSAPGHANSGTKEKFDALNTSIKSAHSKGKDAVLSAAKKTTGLDWTHHSVSESVEIDEANEYHKLAVKHLKDVMSKTATPVQKEYAKKMNKRALEAAKINDPVEAKKHYMGVKEVYNIINGTSLVAEAFQDDGKMDWDAWKQKAKQHGAVKFVDTDNKTIAYDKNSKQVSSITWSSKQQGVAEGFDVTSSEKKLKSLQNKLRLAKEQRERKGGRVESTQERRLQQQMDQIADHIRGKKGLTEGEETALDEKSISDVEMKKREQIVKSMKKNVQGFKARYGDRAKQVMYATATKMAMKEETLEQRKDREEQMKKFKDQVQDNCVSESSEKPKVKSAAERAKDIYDHKMRNASSPADRAEAKADYEYFTKQLNKPVSENAPVAPSIGVHRIAVTVSEPDHPAVSKRSETAQKFVRVTSNSKEHAVEQGKKHFKKKGFKVHGAEHVGMLHEQAEQIDELSKKTLGSYVKSAYADKEVSSTSASFKSGKAGDTYNKAKTSSREERRDTGINKAMHRLTKEEVENLDELSKSTVGSYIKKAKGSAIGAANAMGMTSQSSNVHQSAEKKLQKRASGINKAVDRLTKEEVELDEAAQYSRIWVRQGKAGGSHQVHGKTSDGTVKTLHTGLNQIEATEKAKKLAAKHGIKFNESVELDEANHREFAAQGKMHPDMAKWMQKGRETDFYHSKTGDKISGVVTRNTGKSIHIQANKDGRIGGGETHKFSVSKKLNEEESCVREKARDAMKKYVKEGYDLDLTDDQADDLIAEQYLDELSKATLASYATKSAREYGRDKQLVGRESPEGLVKNARPEVKQKLKTRIAGIDKAVSRLSKEEFEGSEFDDEGNLVQEMISYTDFHSKIAAHKKAGNEIADAHYDDIKKKAHYTVVDKEGTARKVTHTETGSKMENLGSHKGEVEDESGKKVQKPVHEPAEKRGRGRPSGLSGLKYKPRDPASKAASAAKAAASKAANKAK